MNLWKTEPVALLAGLGLVVQALLVLLISYHVAITQEQQAAITGLVAVLLAWITRSQVTPANMIGQDTPTPR